MSWLKKNELDLKRHVQDLRDNIRSNWTTTGQELSKELRQFWPPGSRPQSPAPRGRLALQVPNGADALGLPPSSPLASPSLPPGVPKSPGANTNDFVAGYALGLIGGVRSWVSFAPRAHPAPPFTPSVESMLTRCTDDQEPENGPGLAPPE